MPPRNFPRLRLQYGLRSLLAATFVTCLALGWYMQRVRRQREAVAALTAAGAEIGYYDSTRNRAASIDDVYNFASPVTVEERIERCMPERLKSALGIDFFRPVDRVSWFDNATRGGPELTYLRGLPRLRFLAVEEVLDDDLSALGALGELKSLIITDALITDAGLSRLAALKNIRNLEIGCQATNSPPSPPRGSYYEDGRHRYRQLYPSISDAGLAHLTNARRLKRLTLSGHDMHGNGLVNLAGMSELKSLDLGLTNLRDTELAHLASLRQLQDLNMEGTPITGAGLSALASLPRLDTLNLRLTLVADDGLTALPTFPSLRILDLSGTAVTDQGLRVLSKMASLIDINVDHTNVTAEGARWLRERMPHASVDFNEQGNVELTRAHVFMRAGRWKEAFDTWNHLDADYLQSPHGLCQLGRCHAEMGDWEQAGWCYRRAFEEVACQPLGAECLGCLTSIDLWHELLDCPALFEDVRRARPHDGNGWLAAARRAVVEGRWSAAIADYAQAMRCPREPPTGLSDSNLQLEYAVSRLLARDVAESRRIAVDLIAAWQTIKSEVAEYPPFSTLKWNARHTWLLPPQGTFPTSQITAWSRDLDATQLESASQESLLHYRAGRYDRVLKQSLEGDWPFGADHGCFFFTRAMAHQRLGHGAAAREWLTRATQWFDRQKQVSRLVSAYSNAVNLLAAEALRREAEELILK